MHLAATLVTTLVTHLECFSISYSSVDSWRRGGTQNSRVNLALRAGLILSNPETVRADVHGELQQLAAECYRDVNGWRGDCIVTYRSGQESLHLIHEFTG